MEMSSFLIAHTPKPKESLFKSAPANAKLAPVVETAKPFTLGAPASADGVAAQVPAITSAAVHSVVGLLSPNTQVDTANDEWLNDINAKAAKMVGIRMMMEFFMILVSATQCIGLTAICFTSKAIFMPRNRFHKNQRLTTKQHKATNDV